MAVLTRINKPQPYGKPDQAPDRAFNSRALALFVNQIKKRAGARILDLGPVCNENINLFGRLIKTLDVNDMFSHLARVNKMKKKGDPWWRELDYPAELFDGILLWDLPDRLTDDDAGEASQRCHRILKPGGLVMVCAATDTQKSTAVNAFAMDREFGVTFRLQPYLSLPPTIRKTRDLLEVLEPLQPVQTFIFRNGLRELLLKKT